MEVILNKKIKNPIIIEAFPGIGLIGSITTEYLINHLQCEEVGQIIIDDIIPIVAIHSEKLIKPITLYHDKKNNILIIHSISPVKGIEWKISEAVFDIIKQTQPKQIISLDGVNSQNKNSSKIYFYSNSKKIEAKMQKAGVDLLKESIIMGVTATIMSKVKKDFVGVFAETHLNLPDSRAAAGIIEVLDKYLNLKVDYKPLIKKAEMFEASIKDIMEKGKDVVKLQENKQVNYFG